MATHLRVSVCCCVVMCLLLVDPILCSPLMSVHADNGGRRQRFSSTSWAATSYPATPGDEAALELFNPMVRSKTLKAVDRFRPFNFRPVETEESLSPVHGSSGYFPLFRGGNNEAKMLNGDGPADIEGLKNFVDGLKSRLRDEITLLLSITNAEDGENHDTDEDHDVIEPVSVPDQNGKPRKLFGIRALLHPSAVAFGKRRFVPSQLI